MSARAVARKYNFTHPVVLKHLREHEVCRQKGDWYDKLRAKAISQLAL
jgi:hypothetical protein